MAELSVYSAWYAFPHSIRGAGSRSPRGAGCQTPAGPSGTIAKRSVTKNATPPRAPQKNPHLRTASGMTRITALHRARHASVQLRHPLDTSKLRFALLGRSELTLACADFPICLAKEATTGRFNLIALLSLIEPRNLFCPNDMWHATYRPEATSTAPFVLDPTSEHGMAVDEDSVTLNGGIQLFGADGQPTDALKNIYGRLKRI